jgi:chromosome segregation ATPase
MATEQKDVDDDDIMDFLNSKGLLLEPFKREFLDCEKELESVLIRVQTRERENVKSFAELNGVRDQVSFIRRNIDELQIAQESIRKAIDPMIAKRNSLADKERHNRDEIRRFSAEYEELKVALSVGADWSPEQLEQRQSLEKEHQFLLSKVDNKNSQVSAMRNDVDRLFSEVERLEKEITNIDATTTTVDAKIKTLLITGKDNLKLKESEEKKIFEIRNSIKTAENSVLEKQAQFKSQEIELNEAELSLKNTKQRMEDYIKEYDDLLKSLQDFTSELEKQKHANEKLQEDIDEKKKAIAEKNKEIEWYNKEQNKIIEMKNIVAQKSEEVNAERIAAEEKRETLTKQQSHIARVEINSVRKQIETHDKQIAILKQELEMVKKRQGGSERNAKTVSDLLQANHNGQRTSLLSKNYWKRMLTIKRIRFVCSWLRRRSLSMRLRYRINSITLRLRS